MPTAPFEARLYPGLVVVSGLMWLFGGTSSTTFSKVSDVWASADGVQWVAQPSLPAPLSGFAAVGLSRGILITGGRNSEGFVSVEYAATGVYSTTTSLIPLPPFMVAYLRKDAGGGC